MANLTGAPYVHEYKVSWTIKGVQKTLRSSAAILNAREREYTWGKSRVYKTYSSTISSSASIREVFTETRTSKASIDREYKKTLTSKSDIIKTIAETISSKANVAKIKSDTVTSNARVSDTGGPWSLAGISSVVKTSDPKTIGHKSSIVETYLKTITGKSNVLWRLTGEITSKGRIFETSTTTIGGSARVESRKTVAKTGTSRLVTGGQPTITAKARMVRPRTATIGSQAAIVKSATPTRASTARVLRDDLESRQAQARIVKPLTSTITENSAIIGHWLEGYVLDYLGRSQHAKDSKASVSEFFEKPIAGKADVIKTLSSTVTSKSSVVTTSKPTVVGKAAIREVFTPTVNALSSVVKTLNNTLNGIGNVLTTNTNDITAKANVSDTGGPFHTHAKASVVLTFSDTVASKSSVVKAITYTRSGSARIIDPESRTIDGKSRVVKSGDDTLTSIADVIKTLEKLINSDSRVVKTLTSTIESKTRVVKSLTDTIQSKSDVLKTISHTLNGKSRIGKYAQNDVSSQANVENTMPKTITSDYQVMLHILDGYKLNIYGRYKRDIDSKASVVKTFSDTISSKSDVLKTLSDTLTSTASVNNTVTSTITSSARVIKKFETTIDGLSRIVKSLSDTIDSNSSVLVEDQSATITSKANISDVGGPWHLHSNASVSNTVDPVTIGSKSSAVVTFSDTLTSIASVVKAIQSTVDSTARVVTEDDDETITSIANVVNTLSSTIAGTSRLYISALQRSIDSKASLTAAAPTLAFANATIRQNNDLDGYTLINTIRVSDTIGHSSAVKKTGIRTVTSKARITPSDTWGYVLFSKATILPKWLESYTAVYTHRIKVHTDSIARVLKTVKEGKTGKSSVWKQSTQTISGTSTVVWREKPTLDSKSRVGYPINKPDVSGYKIYFAKRVKRSLDSTASVSNTMSSSVHSWCYIITEAGAAHYDNEDVIYDFGHMFDWVEREMSGRTSILKTFTKTIQSLTSVVKTFQKNIGSKTRVYVRNVPSIGSKTSIQQVYIPIKPHRHDKVASLQLVPRSKETLHTTRLLPVKKEEPISLVMENSHNQRMKPNLRVCQLSVKPRLAPKLHQLNLKEREVLAKKKNRGHCILDIIPRQDEGEVK